MGRKLIEIAQHEAAHVVVGCALGLYLRAVAVGVNEFADGTLAQGLSVFDGRRGSIEAWSIMFAAGSAWEKRAGDAGYAWGDEARLRDRGMSAVGIAALEHAAWCVLKNASAAHARVTRALCEAKRITGAELARLMKHGQLQDE